MSGWIEPDPDYLEQIDWMCEQIKDMKFKLDINNRRVDEIWGKGFDHHLRLLKLEEAKNDN